jgi:acetoin utilization protein AcuB
MRRPGAPPHLIKGRAKKKASHRAPVIYNGKLVGIVTERDLLHASPSSATTLSIWELNYLLTKVTVGQLMAKRRP